MSHRCVKLFLVAWAEQLDFIRCYFSNRGWLYFIQCRFPTKSSLKMVHYCFDIWTIFLWTVLVRFLNQIFSSLNRCSPNDSVVYLGCITWRWYISLFLGCWNIDDTDSLVEQLTMSSFHHVMWRHSEWKQFPPTNYFSSATFPTSTFSSSSGGHQDPNVCLSRFISSCAPMPRWWLNSIKPLALQNAPRNQDPSNQTCHLEITAYLLLVASMGIF